MTGETQFACFDVFEQVFEAFIEERGFTDQHFEQNAAYSVDITGESHAFFL